MAIGSPRGFFVLKKGRKEKKVENRKFKYIQSGRGNGGKWEGAISSSGKFQKNKQINNNNKTKIIFLDFVFSNNRTAQVFC